MLLTRPTLILSLPLVLFTASVCLGTSVYVVNGNGQFGTVDLATGAFGQIGPNTPEPDSGLAPGPTGSLFTLTVSGNLDVINPANGVTRLIGPTGLGDCTSPASPCGPNSASTIADLGGTLYATDLANNLYRVNPVTGAATMIGPTGIPPLPFTLLASNPDGTFNVYDQALFSANGKLYATFDAITINSTTLAVGTVVIPGSLYQIDPTTGIATLIGPTDLGLGAVADVNGTFYAFKNGASQLVTLDLANGRTSVVTDFDPAAGIISGASPTPEPFSIVLCGLGLGAVGVCRLRKRGEAPKRS